MIDPASLAAVMEATWPPAAQWRLGPMTLRDGQGGGKRVSAATADDVWADEDIDRAEEAMGQEALFLIRAGDEGLDAALDRRGYRVVDPVIAYAAPVTAIAGTGPVYMASFPHWPPMAIAASLWAEAGIGPARLAVMARAAGPKTVILSRSNDRASGVAYVACAGRHAMLHALEVSPAFRRQGSAQNILRAAAQWAQAQGADTLSLVVTVANGPARALYQSLGMVEVGHYHYRQR
jgi:ribosomal protein S18 acetylase RimI-like enzyme